MQSFISLMTGRLFWKIFLWFWLTTIVMVFGGAIGTTYLFKDEFRSRLGPFEHRIDRNMDRLSHSLRTQGEEKTKRFLENLRNRRPGKFFADAKRPKPPQIFIIDSQGKELMGRDYDFIGSTEFKELFQQENKAQSVKPGNARLNNANETHTSNQVFKHRLVHTEKGKTYLIILQRPDWRMAFSRLFSRFSSGSSIPYIHLMLSIAFSMLVCFWLSWYLTRPIQVLRQASHDLAKGKLNYKVADKIGRRRDEIADLSIDFDHMAERLQTLLNSQKQLLNDTSHELRSPLARLQVAVSLATQKAGEISDLELLRIVTEINRLDELIGQILTVSRLEAQAHYTLDDYIDIADLLRSIINDAQFEAKSENKKVHLQCCFQGIIKSNAGLLHRAFDNIIRNALHYTHENTQVEVILVLRSEAQSILIKVCDQGNGVPEEQLNRLFEPFFRADDSRERSQGGYGLGLAIAKRAIRLHGGHVKAYNQEPQGLCVEVQLPLNSNTET